MSKIITHPQNNVYADAWDRIFTPKEVIAETDAQSAEVTKGTPE